MSASVWPTRAAALLLGATWAGGLGAAGGSYAARAEQDRELCALGTGMVDVDILVCRRAIRAGGAEGVSLATLHNALGRAYRQRGRADKALAEHAAALALNPSSAVAHLERALSHLTRGELHRAAADLDRALELFPAFGDARRARGRVAFLAGNPGAAIGFLDTAIVAQPHNGEAYAFRGFAHFQQGAYGRAAADFEAVLARNLDYPYASLWLALALERSGDGHERARRVLRDAAMELEADEWPRPLLERFLSGAPRHPPLEEPLPGPEMRRRYETRFYLALGAAGAGAQAGVRDLLAAVVQEAPRLSVEAVMARHALAELAR